MCTVFVISMSKDSACYNQRSSNESYEHLPHFLMPSEERVATGRKPLRGKLLNRKVKKRAPCMNSNN